MKKTIFKKIMYNYAGKGAFFVEVLDETVTTESIPVYIDVTTFNTLDKRNLSALSKNKLTVIIKGDEAHTYTFSASFNELFAELKLIMDKIRELKPGGLVGINFNMPTPTLIGKAEETTNTEYWGFSDETANAALQGIRAKYVQLEIQDIAEDIIMKVLSSTFKINEEEVKEKKAVKDMTTEEFLEYFMNKNSI